MMWNAAKSVFFQFDAESAHRSVVEAIGTMHRVSPAAVRAISGVRQGLPLSPAEKSYSIRVFGVDFENPVGLAAGFDKNAEILSALPDLGFGFAEIGTVTPRPQAGNDRPRLFRDAKRSSLFNRMGFNSDGATKVAVRVSEHRKNLPGWFRVGVNVGKNKDTPLEKAHIDYREALVPFRGLADYIAVNVSSPNTPGLRSLQSLAALSPILREVNDELGNWAARPPVLVKIAPEIDVVEFQTLIESTSQLGIDGWIITNTLAGEREGVPGGWSGEILREAARDKLMLARSLTRAPIISVGGVMDAEEARWRRRMGADLVQLYSGWVFSGPRLPIEAARRWMIP